MTGALGSLADEQAAADDAGAAAAPTALDGGREQPLKQPADVLKKAAEQLERSKTTTS